MDPIEGPRLSHRATFLFDAPVRAAVFRARMSADLVYKSHNIPSQDQSLLLGPQPERADFVNLYTGMQPRTISSKEHLAWPSTLYGLSYVVEVSHTCSISMDIRIANQLLNHPLLCSPIARRS